MTIGRVRPAVEALAPYRPGKGAKQAEEEHGISDAIKLASNENPFPPVPAVVAAITEAAAGVNRYADHRATELRERIGRWLDFDPERVTVGCGSVGLLQQLSMTFLDPGDEVIYPWLSFEAYPVFANTMGATSVRVPLVDHTPDLAAVAAAVTPKTKLILLATPNNPTGTALSTDEIAAFLGNVPNDVIVLIDEAYREFSDPGLGDPSTLCDAHDNLVVFRTLSKAYGLAGLRIGYGLGHPGVITEIDKTLLAFAVNATAQAAAMAALDSLDQVAPNIERLLAERSRVTSALRSAGWSLPDPQANFVWLPVGDNTDSLALALEQRGVVIRPFSGEGMRVTIGTESENDRFLSTLAEVGTPS